jgi:hypothetical protein
MALGTAGQGYDSANWSDAGLFLIHLRTPEGSDFVIGMKYVSGREKIGDKVVPIKPTQLQDNMEKAAGEALDQIEDNKYDLRFQGKGNKIYKVALIVGDSADVLIVLEEADNWPLVPALDGSLKICYI